MSDTDPQQTAYSETHGIIIMLDVLGVRHFSVADSKLFLENRQKLLNWLDVETANTHQTISTMMELFGAIVAEVGPAPNSYPDIFALPPAPKYYTFGDTILIAWEAPRHTKQIFLLVLLLLLGKMLVEGLADGLPLRGAISVGDYIASGETILGPAISDAAAWFDKADWLGLMATPQCSIWLDMLAEYFEGTNRRALSAWAVRYPIPVKNRGTRPLLWAPSWPHWYSVHPDLTNANPKTLFMQHLTAFSMPPGTEDKYANTIDFFDWVYGKAGFTGDELRELLRFELPQAMAAYLEKLNTSQGTAT